ncbi:hypothetical protein [Flagellimonas marina]|uniref:Uncharacterized protein n=1 Tax=Flagellimonas marina TaxID=1775168 RepID=A0ABV8PIN5_9FLAO
MNTEPKSYIEVIKDWENFLGDHPNNFLRIKNLNNNQWLIYNENSTGHSLLKRETVETSDFPDLIAYFDDQIKRKKLNEVYVQFKRTSGNTSVFAQNRKPEKFDLSHRRRELENSGNVQQNNMAQQTPDHQQTFTAVPPQPQAHSPRHSPNGFEKEVMHHMGGLGAAALGAGLGYRELVTLEKKAEMSDHYKGEMERYKKENDILVIDNRDLQGKVNNATREKELAIKETQLATKSWMDSDNLKALIENMGPVVQTILSKGQAGAANQQLGMGSATGISEAKQRLIEYVCAEEVDDAKVVILENALAAMYHRPDFANKLYEIIQNEMSDAAAGS